MQHPPGYHRPRRLLHRRAGCGTPATSGGRAVAAAGAPNVLPSTPAVTRNPPPCPLLPTGLATNPFPEAATYGTDWVSTSSTPFIDFAEFNVYPDQWVRACAADRALLTGRRLGGCWGTCADTAGAAQAAPPCPPPPPHRAACCWPGPQKSNDPTVYVPWIRDWIDAHTTDAKQPLAKPALIKEHSAAVSRGAV